MFTHHVVIDVFLEGQFKTSKIASCIILNCAMEVRSLLGTVAFACVEGLVLK